MLALSLCPKLLKIEKEMESSLIFSILHEEFI